MRNENVQMAALPYPELAAMLGPGVRDRVKQGCDDWQRSLRAAVGSETALRLSPAKGTPVQIRFEVVDGLPAGLDDVVRSIPPMILKLLIHANDIEAAGPGLYFVGTEWDSIMAALRLTMGTDERKAVEVAYNTLQTILKAMPKYNLDEAVRHLRDDVWGCYFTRQHRIEIYWMAIGLFASRWKTREEDMAAVVLTHELVHGYSHVGFDTQDIQWETESFIRASSDIKEGLAQYYTEAICRKFETTDQRLRAAFEMMLRCQEGPYVVHRDWFPTTDTTDNEAVREAMMSARRQGLFRYDAFLALLNEARRKLSATA
jgi:hypothetical protein